MKSESMKMTGIPCDKADRVVETWIVIDVQAILPCFMNKAG